MKEICQNQLLIDGVPAHQFGEWPGLKSSKWTGSIKILRPEDQLNMFSDQNVRLPSFSRRHFSAKPSHEMLFRPDKKQFLQYRNRTQITPKKEGIKSVNPSFTENKLYYAKRHFESKHGIEVDPEPFQIKTFFPNGNTRTLRELSLQQALGPKIRIPDMYTMRNGIMVKAQGDKSFKNPEYTKNFFKEGGLVPGSSFKPNYNRTVSKKADNFYQTLDLSKTTLNPDKLWVNKVKKEVGDFDNNYVKTLSAWESNVLKEYIQPEVVAKGALSSNRGNNNSKSPVKKK